LSETGAIGVAGLVLVMVTAMSAAALAAPAGSAPTFYGTDDAGPPPAWLETQGGDRWLETGDYRWCTPQPVAFGDRPAGSIFCATPPQSVIVGNMYACPQVLAAPPEIRLLPGEAARLRLGFAPTSIGLALGPRVLATPPAADTTLPPASETGGLIVAAGGPWGGEVRYLARIVVTTDATAPGIGAVRVIRDGSRIRVRLRVSEAASVEGCVGAEALPGETITRPALPVLRFVRGAAAAAGEVTLPVAAIAPAPRYRIYLRARDRDGNSTITIRLLRDPLGAG